MSGRFSSHLCPRQKSDMKFKSLVILAILILAFIALLTHIVDGPTHQDVTTLLRRVVTIATEVEVHH